MSRRARQQQVIRRYMPGRAATNTVQIAMGRARRLSDEDVQRQAALIDRAVRDFSKGQHCAAHWSSLADTANMAETLCAMGLGAGPAAERVIETAQRALHDVYQRHAQRGTWTLWADEIDALHWLASLHTTQLAACSYGEFEDAYRRTADRLTQARAGNAAAGAIVVVGMVAGTEAMEIHHD